MTLDQLRQTALNLQLPGSTEILIGIEVPGFPPEFTRVSLSQEARYDASQVAIPAETNILDVTSAVTLEDAPEELVDNPNALVLWVETSPA